ncbi:zinc ion binding [Striga asiatica]|uniref:Zinc ion binding n=1 Tax=Striga asiatica TaxID=4170 RepID=A0A5A7R123_STRAF|nr:zinc ion binding [Striga asiatica]
MDLHPSPFPVKYMKLKPTRKIPQASKINKVGPLVQSEKRVFGTARNPNIPPKTAPTRGKTDMQKKVAKPSQSIKDSSGRKSPLIPKKKSVCFQENERNGELSGVEPQTPAKSPTFQSKPRLSVTPFHSAEKCSKCRFDRLETSTYWLSQIRLAETVGKHSVSAVFFQLAFDCQAEPVRNIRLEFKKYMQRHEHLNGEVKWKKLLVSYGLVKEESSTGRQEVNKADLEEENATSDHGNGEGKNLLNEMAGEIET